MMDAPDVPNRDPREIDWPLEFPLSKVVKAHGEDVKVLVLEEPTGEDVLAFGLLDGLGPEQFWPLVAKLAKVPMSTLKSCAGRDILQLGTVLSRFFRLAAEPPTPSTTASA